MRKEDEMECPRAPRRQRCGHLAPSCQSGDSSIRLLTYKPQGNYLPWFWATGFIIIVMFVALMWTLHVVEMENVWLWTLGSDTVETADMGKASQPWITWKSDLTTWWCLSRKLTNHMWRLWRRLALQWIWLKHWQKFSFKKTKFSSIIVKSLF